MAEIDRLNFVMGMNTAGMTRGGATVSRIFGKMDNKFKAILGTIGIMGAVFVGFSIKAVKAASKFQDAFNEVRTLIDETTTDSKALSREVLKLAVNVGRPPEEVSRGLYQVISAGVTDAAEAMDVLEIATKASIGGLTDQFTAVDAVTTVLNAYNLEVTEAEHVTDLMLNAVKEGKLTFNDLASNIGKVASTASLAGVGFAEISAALATMTKAGLSTELATTSLNTLLLKIIDSGPEVQRAAKDMGLEWNLAALKARGLTGLMEDLSKASGGNVEKMKSIVKEIEAFKGASILAGTGLKEFTRIMETTNNVAGTTREFFDKIKQSVSETAKEISTRLTVAFIKLGNIVLPAIQSSLKGILSLIKQFTQTDLEKSIDALDKISGVEALVRRLELQQQIDEELVRQTENEQELNAFLKEKNFLLTRNLEINRETGEIIKGQLPPQLDALKRILDMSTAQDGINKLLEIEKQLKIESNETEILLAEARFKKNKNEIEFAKNIKREVNEQLSFLRQLLSLKSNVQLSDEQIAKKLEEINLLLEGGIKKQKKTTEASDETTKSITKQKEELEDKIELIKQGTAAEIALIRLTGKLERTEAKLIKDEVTDIQKATAIRLSEHLAQAIKVYGAESLFVTELQIAIAKLKLEAEEEITVTIKTGLVFDGIDKSSRAVAGLGRELGLFADTGELTIRRIGDISLSLRDFIKAIKNSESGLLDKLIPGLGIATIGISLLSDVLGDSGKEADEATRSIKDFADSMREISRLQSLAETGDIEEIQQRAGALLQELFDQAQNLEDLKLGELDEFLRLLGLLSAARTEAEAERAAQNLDRFINENAEFIGRIFDRLRESNEDLANALERDFLDFENDLQDIVEALQDIADALKEAVEQQEKFSVGEKGVGVTVEDQPPIDLGGVTITGGGGLTEEEILALFARGGLDESQIGLLTTLLQRLREPSIDDIIGGDITDIFQPPENRVVRQFVGITEIQGNLFIGIMNTQREIQQEILNVLNDRLGGIETEQINEVLDNDVENAERGAGVG